LLRSQQVNAIKGHRTPGGMFWGCAQAPLHVCTFRDSAQPGAHEVDIGSFLCCSGKKKKKKKKKFFYPFKKTGNI